MLVACTPKPNAALPPQTANVQQAILLWDNPVPIPKFIRHFEIWQNNVDNRLCIQLNIFEIFEPGDNPHEIELSIGNTLQFNVDSFILPEDKLIFASIATLITRRDDKGNVIGSHGGDMSICFEVSGLSDGLHQGSISFQSTSHKQYQYEWAFKKSSQDKKIVIQLPDSLHQF